MRACAHECACIYVCALPRGYLPCSNYRMRKSTHRPSASEQQDVTVTFTTRDLRTQTVFSPARQMIAVVVTELFVQVSLCSMV